MLSQTRSFTQLIKWWPIPVAAIGLLLWLGSLWALYEWERLFTESHLVGYYCCVVAADLPQLGSLARSLSDFFNQSPGMYLPAIIWVGVNIGLLARGLWSSPRPGWLPLAFAGANLIYPLASLIMVALSWQVSDWFNGPITSPFKGYDRTWPGIALHLVLWGALSLALYNLPRLRKRLPAGHPL